MRVEDFESFKDRVWTTRMSRINAERRLLKKEKFVQGINIYYSCFCIFLSILTLSKADQSLSMISVFITIALFISILYSNSQGNLQQAKDYRENYVAINELEYELQHIDENDDEKIMSIEKSYCKLLKDANNHEEYDYFRTVYESSGDYHKKNWSNVRLKYYWNVVWRLCIQGLIILVPIIIMVIWG